MTIKHSCEHEGCYVETQTPDWAILDGVFSNAHIKVGDLDGAVEANGHLLILEWKRMEAGIPLGQSLMFKKITKRSDIMVFIIQGDPVTSTPEYLYIFRDGEIIYQEFIDLRKLRKIVKSWETKAWEDTL